MGIQNSLPFRSGTAANFAQLQWSGSWSRHSKLRDWLSWERMSLLSMSIWKSNFKMLRARICHTLSRLPQFTSKTPLSGSLHMRQRSTVTLQVCIHLWLRQSLTARVCEAGKTSSQPQASCKRASIICSRESNMLTLGAAARPSLWQPKQRKISPVGSPHSSHGPHQSKASALL